MADDRKPYEAPQVRDVAPGGAVEGDSGRVGEPCPSCGAAVFLNADESAFVHVEPLCEDWLRSVAELLAGPTEPAPA